jgi:DNA helicase MCM8
MLSRFDLIFVLLDRPDEMMDQALSEHIMALHSGEQEGVFCTLGAAG